MNEEPGPEEFVRRLGEGDTAAEETLYHHYMRGVRVVLMKRLDDLSRVEDLLHDVFLIALERIRAGALEDPGKLSSYLAGIARFVAMDQNKTSRRRATSPDTDTIQRVATEDPGPFQLLGELEERLLVRQVMAELPQERDRELLRRWYVEAVPVERLCEDFGVTRKHFSRLKYRATQRLIELVRKREG